MKKKPLITPADVALAEIEAENNRQRWLVRSGHRAYGPQVAASERRTAGVHTSRSSARGRGSENWRQQGPRSSYLGNAAVVAIGVVMLLGAGMWLALAGLVWLGFEVVRWALGILFGGMV